MTGRQHATSRTAVKLSVAGVIIAGGALAMAGQAGADPAVPYPTPVPSAPGDPAVPPGQPVAVPVDAPAAPAPPPPVGTRTVPEIPNPNYGGGSGPLSSLRDIWHQAQDPYGVTNPNAQMPLAAPPPPGAGAAPQLPPGYVSTNAPESNGPPSTKTYSGGTLPPGYYPLTGPPPPGYFAPDPNVPVPIPADAPIPAAPDPVAPVPVGPDPAVPLPPTP
jgi:hypothetical protein